MTTRIRIDFSEFDERLWAICDRSWDREETLVSTVRRGIQQDREISLDEHHVKLLVATLAAHDRQSSEDVNDIWAEFAKQTRDYDIHGQVEKMWHTVYQETSD